MTEFISSVINANREIFYLINSFDNSLKKNLSKGYGGDISTSIDIKAEEIFIKYLSSFGKIFSEESGYIGDGNNLIIIDPLDGSDNFKSNFPYFGTSVSLVEKSITKEAVIVNLSNQDIFIKNKDYFKKGKLFENNYINVEKNDFSTIGIFEKGYSSKEYANYLREKNIKYRIPGAIALSLAYAHEVEFVIFEGKMREFDLSAGIYMCEDLYNYQNDEILIVSKKKEIFDILKEYYEY